MNSAEATSWSIIRDASSGREASRAEFARRYSPVIRAYLRHRWRRSSRRFQVDDAIQDVFVECFRSGGVLDKADPSRPAGFRGFLFGVVRNIALRIESKRGREEVVDTRFSDLPDDDPALSRVLDQQWVSMLLREAARLQEERAVRQGRDAERRLDLLRLRFEQDLPIREIAARWQLNADFVHRQYRLARREFRSALECVLRSNHGDEPLSIDLEGECLLALFD